MGARMLKKWLEKPSLDIGEINRRLDAVQQINKNIILRDDIMSSMRGFMTLNVLREGVLQAIFRQETAFSFAVAVSLAFNEAKTCRC